MPLSPWNLTLKFLGLTAAKAIKKSNGGRPKKYEWVEDLVCRHHGRFCDERNPDLSPQKRRPNRHQQSVKVGCKARISLRKMNGSDLVRIEYVWQHTGHTVGILDDMKGSMLPRPVNEYIEERVAQQMDWHALKKLLRVDARVLTAIDHGELYKIPEALRIAQKDVYNAMQRQLIKLAQHDPNGYKSLKIWEQKLISSGYAVYFKPVSAQADGENSYVFAFVSPWQKSVRIS